MTSPAAPVRIALDAMGGDHAPQAMVEGGLDYARAHPAHTVILVGRKPDLEACLARTGTAPNLAIEHASEIIGMAEKIQALKDKPDDSMNRCSLLVKEGKADAMVLCGNTGCSVAAAQLHLRRVPGVKRAGILTPMPKPQGQTWMCDCGANSVGKAEHLVQFAEMTVAFLEVAYGRKNPKVGVLSNGEEDGKGTELTAETLEALRKTALNVVGYVEGHHVFNTDVDVVVCDGFTGNIVLKTSEGVEAGMRTIIKEEVSRRTLAKLGYTLMKPAFEGVKRRVDWRYTGGCILIGVDGVTIIGHGRSDRVAVYHALGWAARCVETRLMTALRDRFRALSASTTGNGPHWSEPVWQVRRRPSRRYLHVFLALSLVAAVASTLLLRMLMLRPQWEVPLALGVVIGAATILVSTRGAVAAVDASGTLSYGFGGTASLTVDLRLARRIERVRHGMLDGVGLDVDPDRVVFLRRKGLSYRTLRAHQRTLGLALVLEFLTDDDLAALRALHARFVQA